MEHGDLAQLAAVAGAVGALLALVPGRRSLALGGLLLLAVAEGCFAVALAPPDAREQLTRPAVAVAVVVAAVAAAGLAVLFVRVPAAVPVALVAAAPFRIPVTVGDERAFLLLPFYLVAGAAAAALAWRLLRDPAPRGISPVVSVPAAAVVAVVAVSLLWTVDLRAGSIALAFFFFPFTVIVATIARTPWAPWLTRALAVVAVGSASVFALIGLWQVYRRTIFFAPDVEVANAYTSFFRVTSLFKDPSLYGRYLVIAIVVLLVAVLLEQVRLLVALPLFALLWTGLFFSYSQSSFAALFVVAVAVAVVAGDRRTRLVLAGAAVLGALVAGVVAVRAVGDESLRSATSGRSRLVDVTLPVIEKNPVAGVGIGGQPLASAREVRGQSLRRNASHTTPLTIAAELGAIGLAAYALFLAAVAVTLRALVRVRRPLALALAATFLVLVVHSLVYAGFFEDPVTWIVPAVAAAALGAIQPLRVRSWTPLRVASRADAPAGDAGRG